MHSRATAFIGTVIEALPLIGAIGIPAAFIATRPEMATAQGFDMSSLMTLASSLF
jgi:hypothetical protein